MQATDTQYNFFAQSEKKIDLPIANSIEVYYRLSNLNSTMEIQMSLFHKTTPSEHRRYLEVFLLALFKKRIGSKKLAFGTDHFNQVVREAKAVLKDPGKARSSKFSSNYLVRCMLNYKDLKQEIMNINTLDDVDEDTANRILLRLEPAYARPE